MKKLLPALFLLALGACATAPAGTSICSNDSGMREGRFFTFWHDTGEGCMTLRPGGGYAVDWRLGARGNLVAGTGWARGTLDRVVRYKAEAFDPGRNGYLTLYGWSTDPLIEYYVVDSWGGFEPPGNQATALGTLQSDGATYRIYRTQRVQQPSIRGTQTFYQYWSVRETRIPVGTDSTITFANHVAAWRAAGLELGTMNYQVLATEGFGSDGNSVIDISGF